MCLDELASSLTPDNVNQLQIILGIPYAIIEKTGTDAIDFLFSLKSDFKEFRTALFHEALRSIGRADLIPIASQVSWLNVSFHKQTSKAETSPTIESFVSLLRTEVETKQWKLIVGNELSQKGKSKIDFETALRLSIEGGLISPDLVTLCSMMRALSREDLVARIGKYASVFQGMDRTEFQNKLLDELESDEKAEHDKWASRLRDYVNQQNNKVSILLDDDENVLLESVYTPLTVVKEELIKITAAEETTLNEIAFLKSMSDEKKTLETVDLISLVSAHDPNEPEVLCLIGSPGSGKTFLCKYLALLYGKSELRNFTYVLSVPCRSEEWHQMEKTRHEAELEIEEEFIQKWLSLTMPVGIRWSKSLIKHLSRSGGEDLLLIIDGADEFIKDVPFKSTLLFSIIQKRSLNRCTVLLTSRPGAWSELREQHGKEMKVDSNFQVLGFSPIDRDSYFKKRMNTADKLRETKELFVLHDEINQLSLVPVNASLFTSLFNETANILSQTLTHLYTELIVYIIRRQLARMGLKLLTKVQRMSEFHPSILECIRRIGEEAYEGIFHRELTSREEDISIEIGETKHATERLGLMQVHVKLLKLGQRVNVWTFAHLTLQEYMAAVYLDNRRWVEECVIMRFIVSSEDVFAMYKMVVRFTCGLLVDKASCLIPIICRNLTPDPMSLVEMPMSHQLYYFNTIVNVSDWIAFTKLYLLVATIIVETNSHLINEYFCCFKTLFPEYLYFYFLNSVSPNEWRCFVISLKYINKLQIVYINLSLISAIQFDSLLRQLSYCSLSYLALRFYKQDYQSIQSYTKLLDSTDISLQYKISIDLQVCELSETQHSSPLFASHNKFIGSIHLNESKLSNRFLTQLFDQFSCLENLCYAPKSDASDWTIIESLITDNCQMNGLYIQDPDKYLPLTPYILPSLSSLQEIMWSTEDPYTILPYLPNNNLTFLFLLAPDYPPVREEYGHQLTELLTTSCTSMTDIGLFAVHTIGFNSWTSFLTPIQSCHNLVSLSLFVSQLSSDDISYWFTAIRYLQSLAVLFLYGIPLEDTGLMILCQSLTRHPAIRRLMLSKCSLTSVSCEPISMLIHTLPYLRQLQLDKPDLSQPDSNPLPNLIRTAELFSVEIKLDDIKGEYYYLFQYLFFVSPSTYSGYLL